MGSVSQHVNGGLRSVQHRRDFCDRTALEIVQPHHLRVGLREPVDRRKLERLTSGRTVRDVRRRAKYLLVDMDGRTTLVTHLGMSGRMTLVAGEVPREPHERR